MNFKPKRPTTYKPDAIIQMSIDRRKVATIVDYLVQNNIRPRNRNDLMNIIVDNFIRALQRQGAVLIETTHEANKILSENNLGDLNPGDRLKMNHLHNLNLDVEDEYNEINEVSTKHPSTTEVDTDEGMPSSEDIAQITQAFLAKKKEAAQLKYTKDGLIK